VVAPDGSTSLVDVSRVQPLTDPDGNVMQPFGPTMLSPTGRFLLFPQQHDLLVYHLATGHWQTLDPRGQTTEWAQWANDTQIALPPRSDGGFTHLVDVNGTSGGTQDISPPRGPLTREATPYGRLRTGPLGVAQSWSADPGVPVPDGDLQAPQVVVVGQTQHPAVLVLRDSGEERQKECCTVQFWLDPRSVAYQSADADTVVAWTVGTHRFRKVTTISGYQRGQERVVGSYIRIWSTFGLR
jgi:hypothetical protein